MDALEQLYYNKKEKERVRERESEKKTFNIRRAFYAGTGKAISIQCQVVINCTKW